MIEVHHLYLDSVNVLFVDLALFLCGEPGEVQASKKTFIKERPFPITPVQRGKVDVDDFLLRWWSLKMVQIATFEDVYRADLLWHLPYSRGKALTGDKILMAGGIT